MHKSTKVEPESLETQTFMLLKPLECESEEQEIRNVYIKLMGDKGRSLQEQDR